MLDSIEALTTWVESVRLKLAAKKTKALPFTIRRKFMPSIFRMGEVEIKSLSEILKSMFHGKLSFRERFRRAIDREKQEVGDTQCTDAET